VSLTLRARKLALVAHIAASVGWIGAVLSSLVLAAAPLISGDPTIMRGSYLSLQVIGWYALVPFSIASLLTGLVQSLGTAWGLARHYWVLVKLLMNLFATAILLLYTQTLDQLAATARDPHSAIEGNPSPIAHAAGAVALLTAALVLSVYKPRGMTRYGRRRTASGTAPSRLAAAGTAKGSMW